MKHNELLTESNVLKRANKELNDENEQNAKTLDMQLNEIKSNKKALTETSEQLQQVDAKY